MLSKSKPVLSQKLLDLLKENPIDWLLSADDPAILSKVYSFLEGDNSKNTLKYKTESLKRGVISKILDAREEKGYWYGEKSGSYKKYQGTLWQLIFLTDLEAPKDEPRIKKSLEYLLDNLFHKGRGISASTSRATILPCQTAQQLYSLGYFNMRSDSRYKEMWDILSKIQEPNGTIQCREMNYSILDGCVMMLPKILKAYSVVPENERTEIQKQIVTKSYDYLCKYNLLDYIPENSKVVKELYKKYRGKLLYEKLKNIMPSEKRLRKPKWLKIGFPLNYDSDLLEVLNASAKAGMKKNKAIENGIELLLSLQKNGKWIMRNSLNGKLIYDIEKRGKPSRWLTIRAIEVLAYYC